MSRKSVLWILLLLGLLTTLAWSLSREDTVTLSPPIANPGSWIPKSDPPLESIHLGIVELFVADKKLVSDFYHEAVGFEILSESGETLTLGEWKNELIRLIEKKGYQYPTPGEAGLYHTAITHSSRKDLAERIARILETHPERYLGSADHSATEAFYFTDPEGNGLELYYDKPRSEWKYENGLPVMGSYPLDTLDFIRKYRDLPGSSTETKMWHVHLKVGDITEALDFYHTRLQFDIMSNLGTALFVARDGYHHHLGLNTWESLGARKRPPNTYGLKSFEVIYHDRELYEKIRENLDTNSIIAANSGTAALIEDPWGNQINLRYGE